MFIRNFNLGARLTIGFALLAVLIFIQGILSLQNMSKLQEAQNDISDNWMASIEAIGDLDISILRYRVFAVKAFVDTTPEGIRKIETRLQEIEKDLVKAQEQYEKVISEPQEREIYPKLIVLKTKYIANSNKMIELIKAGDIEDAKNLMEREQNGLADEITKYLLTLTEVNEHGADKSAKNADTVYSHSQTIIITSIIVALILTALLAYNVTRSITQPIQEAVRATELIAGGNLTQRIESTGSDEPARLLAGLSLMQDSLRSTISEIANSSTQLAAATEELSSVAEDATRNLHRQNDEIQQAATAITEMSAAVDEVARNANSTSEASNQSSELARKGREQVKQTVTSIQAMSDEVIKTSQLIEGLADQSQNISKVMDVIRAIAEQTNLLALNAAIEAARAGEAGRGFAVVADEVRALAHRTQLSTQEIAQMISQIQAGSTAAVVSMRNSADYTKNTLNVAQEAGKALDEINERSGTISDRNLLIASASEEQAAVAREVDRNIINISDLSTQSAAGANQTSASANELARLATSLNMLISRFVV